MMVARNGRLTVFCISGAILGLSLGLALESLLRASILVLSGFESMYALRSANAIYPGIFCVLLPVVICTVGAAKSAQFLDRRGGG